MSNKEIYERVTNRVISELKKGKVPWKKPFTRSNMPINWSTGHVYSGSNLWFLEPGGEYATFKQIKDGGGHIIKGSKGIPIIFGKEYKKKVKNTNTNEEEEEKYYILREFTVFNVLTQTTGLEPRLKEKELQLDINNYEDVDDLIKQYLEKSHIKFYETVGEAYYMPSTDTLHFPRKEGFKKLSGYYSTIFHEIIHSTGAETRLSRKGILNSDGFGSKSYAFEELVAEMGSALLMAYFNIETNYSTKNNIAYIQSWIKKLESNVEMLVKASTQSNTAVKYVTNLISVKKKVDKLVIK